MNSPPESGGLARSAGVVPKRPFLRMTLRNHTLLRITNRRQSKRKIEVPPDPASFKSEQHSKHRVQPTKSNRQWLGIGAAANSNVFQKAPNSDNGK